MGRRTAKHRPDLSRLIDREFYANLVFNFQILREMFAPVTQVLVEDADQRRKRCTRVILRILSPCASLHLQQASHLFLFRKLQTREVPGEPPLRYVGLSHAGCGSFWTYYRAIRKLPRNVPIAAKLLGRIDDPHSPSSLLGSVVFFLALARSARR